MKAEVGVNPRKNPKQERSQTLVGAVLEASARILDLNGYARLTTNKVAELAGVSIGSLYQYFPGKDALMAAVLERHVNQIMDQFVEQVKAAGR
jgi:AcrR family transcriptional regulator